MTEKTATPLKKLRESRGLTQAAVCEEIGIDQSTYSKIESGTHAPRKDNAEALVRYFGSAINETMLFFPERFSDYKVGQE